MLSNHALPTRNEAIFDVLNESDMQNLEIMNNNQFEIYRNSQDNANQRFIENNINGKLKIKELTGGIEISRHRRNFH